MIETTRQIFILISKTKKVWLIPLLLLLVAVVFLVVAASVAPVPLFMYPII